MTIPERDKANQNLDRHIEAEDERVRRQSASNRIRSGLTLKQVVIHQINRP
jgi:hypothetical protein